MFRIIRIKRVDVDSPAGVFVDFNNNNPMENVEDVCSYLWGKDISNYLIIKDGDALHLPRTGNLDEIKEYLISGHGNGDFWTHDGIISV